MKNYIIPYICMCFFLSGCSPLKQARSQHSPEVLKVIDRIMLFSDSAPDNAPIEELGLVEVIVEINPFAYDEYYIFKLKEEAYLSYGRVDAISRVFEEVIPGRIVNGRSSASFGWRRIRGAVIRLKMTEKEKNEIRKLYEKQMEQREKQ